METKDRSATNPNSHAPHKPTTTQARPQKRASKPHSRPKNLKATVEKNKRQPAPSKQAARPLPDQAMIPDASPPQTASSATTYQDMVQTAAYYIAERKNFQAGIELDNWLEAERQINIHITKQHKTSKLTH